jgi:Protein kinase domain
MSSDSVCILISFVVVVVAIGIGGIYCFILPVLFVRCVCFLLRLLSLQFFLSPRLCLSLSLSLSLCLSLCLSLSLSLSSPLPTRSLFICCFLFTSICMHNCIFHLQCSVLVQMDHPNICKLYQALRVSEEVWMVMELIQGGNLKQASESPCRFFYEPEIAYVAREMLQGIAYLHALKLAHRDLKNINVMLTVNGGIKLIDFGLCADFSNGPRR